MPVIQFNTRNKSAIKCAYLLKELGVKNNYFHMILYDADLLHVDPHAEDLDLNTQIKIYIECRKNPWYFFREVLRVPDSSDKYFEFHRANLALIFCLMHNINSIILTPRQCYKSTTSMGWYLWGMKFGFRNTTVGLFTLSESLSANNLKRLKVLRDALPSYLQTKNKKDIDNATSMKFVTDNNQNQIVVKTVGRSKDTAEDSARGYSFQCLAYDEFAFIEHISAHYATAIYAHSTAARNAEASGNYHHVLMATTAGNLYKECGMWAYNMIQKAAPFHEKLYDMTLGEEFGSRPDLKQIYGYTVSQSIQSKSIATAFMKIEYEYFELGKGDDYLETQRELSKNDSDPTSFEREILMKWQTQAGDHPLGKERVEIIRDTMRKPNYVTVVDNIYMLNIYREQIDPNIPYIIGLDASGNTGNDYSTFVAVDPTNFEVVATMRINQYSITRFAMAIVYIMTRIMPHSIIIVERNGVGMGVVDYIENNISSRRIFKDEKDVPGVHSNEQLRNLLYGDILKVVAMHYYDLIHDKNIISEIMTLEYDRRGRVNHPEGGHDDTLMAYLWCMWFILHYKHKNKYLDPMYIGLNLNNSYSSSEVETIVKTNKRSLMNMLNTQSNPFDLGIPRDITAGLYENETDALDRQMKNIKYQTENMFKNNSKFDFISGLTVSKSKKMEENTSGITERQIHNEEEIDNIENQKNDVEDLESQMIQSRKKELMTKLFSQVDYNRFYR